MNETARPAPPEKLRDADLAGLPRVQLPPELLSSEAARQATPEELVIATRLFEATCRSGYKPASLRNDLDEIAYIARTTARRLKHRWFAVAELLGLYECDDGRLWSELAIPVCEDVWARRLAARDAVRARLRPSSVRRPAVAMPPPHARQPRSSPSRCDSESISTPFESDSSPKIEDSCGVIAQEGKAQGEGESHTPLTESVAEAASLRSGVCVVASLEREASAVELQQHGEQKAVELQPSTAATTANPPRRPPSRQDFDDLVQTWPNREAIEAAWPVYQKAIIDNLDVTAADIADAAGIFLDTLDEKYKDDQKVARFAGQLRNWLRDKRWLDDLPPVLDEYQKFVAAVAARPPRVWVGNTSWDGPPPKPWVPPTPEERAEIDLFRPPRQLTENMLVEETPEEIAEFQRQKAEVLAACKVAWGEAAVP